MADGVQSNSHTILEEKPAALGVGLAKGTIVLVHLGENPYTPYVTWFWNEESGGYAQGHYFEDLGEAYEDWKIRT